MLRVIAISTLLVALVLGVLVALGADEQILRLLRWFESLGVTALPLFILVMAMAVVFLLPGVPFTVGAGAVFGVVEGTIGVVVGTTLGATLSFLIARYLFGERARKFILARAKLRFISDEITPLGWKVVLCSRLVPFFPSKLSNYVFGLTSFSLRGFIGGTLVGLIPFSLHNVYLGAIAGDITGLSAQSVARTPVEWAFYITCFILVVAAIFFLGRLAQQTLARHESKAAN